jgi:hypothetical protein
VVAMSFGLGQAEPSDIFIVNIELWSVIDVAYWHFCDPRAMSAFPSLLRD